MPCGPAASRSSAPRPILPPTSHDAPAASRIWPISAVVVDLPLVPVMPTKRAPAAPGPAARRRRSSARRRRAPLPPPDAAGKGFGNAGADHQRGDASTSRWPRDRRASRRSAPRPARAPPRCRPRRHSRRPPPSGRAPSPGRSAPAPARRATNPARTARSIIGSPQLQGGEAGHRQDGGDDPEADDDGRLGPALLLEVMVQRRHAEDALAGAA